MSVVLPSSHGDKWLHVDNYRQVEDEEAHLRRNVHFHFFPISRFITTLCINRGRISPTYLLLQQKRGGGLQNDHQSIKPWLWKQRFELQHCNFSGQVNEVTLILPFHKQARAQMRCKRSKWSSNFKWPKPNYVFASCFSISLKMKLTIKCLWTVSLGQLRELKKNQYKLLLNIYLVFTKDRK